MDKQMHKALDAYRKKSHLENDATSGLTNAALMGIGGHVESPLGIGGAVKAQTGKGGRAGRMGRGMLGAALSSIAANEISDATMGEEARGTKGYEALRGGIGGAGAGASWAGSAPFGKSLVKYLMATKGLGKAGALAAVLGIPAVGMGALGAGVGALSGVSEDE